MTTKRAVELLAQLDRTQRDVSRRDDRYRGDTKLKFATTEVTGELNHFGVNLCALAVDAVAERMRIKRFHVDAGGRDATANVRAAWRRSNMDQKLMPVLVDALALGSCYLTVWPDRPGRPIITPESARHMTVARDPLTGEVVDAVKRWQERDHNGVVRATHAVHYERDQITRYRSDGDTGRLAHVGAVGNPLGVVPVVPLINIERIGDAVGSSVIDDLAHLVDALGKLLADMLVASEDVARPRRWATGVALDDDDGDDGWTADGDDLDPAADEPPAPAVSPFESGNRMFTVESPEAKFGQLPGADLAGYKTGVDLLLQSIMAVSALPAHMVGITTANPSSADAIRAAEASLTARAEGRIHVLGVGIEQALALVAAFTDHVDPRDVDVKLSWASTATRSTAQEADAVTKLYSLGIIDRDEARERMGIGDL